ncbi:hypothetical protein [Streptomyces yaizuensis]|uniref:ARC6/PARC6 family protein n=1 Tax=Streptomyces yaizuensis TaxID=2989713 RepID=A0ABQ5P716_9ACTN|nr:hypothetical protein [Streptomyces sp. YSPA8]GLF98388.1 ARC6/PARC6 family protein [Streptomyces sp. YSPA8]
MTRRRTAALALVLALLLCGYGAWSLFRARGDDSLAHARERDAALADGAARVAELTGHEPRDPDATRTRWLAAATGPLHEELRRAKKPAPGPGARAAVTAAALTALDTRAGTATLIATVRVTPSDGAEERKRLEARLARTPDDGWKVEALTAVPVGDA